MITFLFVTWWILTGVFVGLKGQFPGNSLSDHIVGAIVGAIVWPIIVPFLSGFVIADKLNEFKKSKHKPELPEASDEVKAAIIELKPDSELELSEITFLTDYNQEKRKKELGGQLDPIFTLIMANIKESALRGQNLCFINLDMIEREDDFKVVGQEVLGLGEVPLVQWNKVYPTGYTPEYTTQYRELDKMFSKRGITMSCNREFNALSIGWQAKNKINYDEAKINIWNTLT